MKRNDKTKKGKQSDFNHDEIMKLIDSAVKKFNDPENKRKTEMWDKMLVCGK